ncbi:MULTISPECIES: DUF3103 domain-containing protein [Shewanella]|uniref:DUF3103 domain-containing protein n=1 Tax=Shewanella septentrionalis TaxID=2952223 RepID=A0A9X3AVE4_9GAMM|nr:DUF3103 domain-containing protein [Shewanella septentrionalis]MCT7947146.1 DUF3103 domain-containing protein [Shewanella septentrionalis]
MKLLQSSLLLCLSASATMSYGQALDGEALRLLQASLKDSTLDAQAQLTNTKRALALDLSHQYAQLAPILQTEINQYQLAVNADDILSQHRLNDNVITKADASIRRVKGLSAKADSLVQVRLADETMLTPWQQGESPLFAYEPDGDESQWDYIEAFDIHGQVHQLDVYNLPQQPVFVVGIDSKKAFVAGLEVMRATFAEAQSAKKDGALLSRAQTQAVADKPISTTVIKQISLKDDHEPWISGRAEIYGIVTGVDPSREEPVLDIVEMPYLDYADTTYYPNQIIIHWERYRWAAADMILMEHDDGTNYKVLATKLLEAAEQILKSIPDPEAQGYALIPQITNGILSVMPDAWFTNDDDFVDVYYTLLEGVEYPNLNGANGNAMTSFAPLVIQPRP